MDQETQDQLERAGYLVAGVHDPAARESMTRVVRDGVINPFNMLNSPCDDDDARNALDVLAK